MAHIFIKLTASLNLTSISQDFEQGASLRLIIIKDAMPNQILQRKKQGFVGPDSFYQNIDWYRKELTGGVLVENQIITDVGLNTLLEQKDHWRLWKLLVLEKWYRTWV